MKWSEIDTAFQELKENLEGIGTKIETARRHHGQIRHANFKPQYTSKVRTVQRRFVILKRRLEKLSGFSEIFEKLGAQIVTLSDLSNDVSTLGEASTQADTCLNSLGRKIRKRKEEDFDAFTTHRREVAIDRKLCFVMMPFKPERVFNPVYRAIRRAVRGKKLKCVRSDNVFDTRAVVIDIWERTRKAVACIADTSPPNNPNVFYEIGLAHALPTRVILISRRLKPDEKYPFDINYARCIFYDQTVSGYRDLERDISRTLRTILR